MSKSRDELAPIAIEILTAWEEAHEWKAAGSDDPTAFVRERIESLKESDNVNAEELF